MIGGMSLKNLQTQLRAEYDHMISQCANLPDVMHDDINVDDVLSAYVILADFFTDPSQLGLAESMLVGVRDYGLLMSAVGRQLVSFGGVRKYTEPLQVCATLFYGLVKNHAFLDGNKRVALLTLLYHLTKRGYVPKSPITEFESLVVSTAANNLQNDYWRIWRSEGNEDMSYADRCVLTIARVLKRSTQRKDNTFHIDVTSRDLCAALLQVGVESTVEGSKIHFRRVISRKTWLHESVVKTASIPYRGDTRTIGAKSARYVLQTLDLYDQYASYDALIDGADPRYMLIDRFEGPLRRLKDK